MWPKYVSNERFSWDMKMMWLIALTSPVGPLFGPGVLGTGVAPPTPPPPLLLPPAPPAPPVPPELFEPLKAKQPTRHKETRAMIANCQNEVSRARSINHLCSKWRMNTSF